MSGNGVMWVKQCHKLSPQITIFIGAMNHSQMHGLWHCFTHITPTKVLFVRLLFPGVSRKYVDTSGGTPETFQSRLSYG
jgi:hypothetical protein